MLREWQTTLSVQDEGICSRYPVACGVVRLPDRGFAPPNGADQASDAVLLKAAA
jgi:hypothetical protein